MSAVEYIGGFTSSDSSVGVVTFANIPQTYRDLFLSVQGRSVIAQTSSFLFAYINFDSSALYSLTRLYGNGSGTSSDRATAYAAAYFGEFPGALSVSQDIGICVAHLIDYTNTSKFKTIISQYGSSATFVGQYSTMYRSTNAISRLDCYIGGVAFSPGTSFSLWGVK